MYESQKGDEMLAGFDAIGVWHYSATCVAIAIRFSAEQRKPYQDGTAVNAICYHC